MSNLAGAPCPIVSESGLPTAEPFRVEQPTPAGGAVSEINSAPLPPASPLPGSGGAGELPSVRTPPAVAPRPVSPGY